MFCFVDFRNRPQYKYTFHSREKAREYLRKIQNNPLGATVIHADGRREYFASGVPANLLRSGSDFRIEKGCHVKYKIRPLAVMDGIASNRSKGKTSNISNWKSLKSSPLFMLGNLKFSACLLIISITAFSFTYLFQKNFGRSAMAEELKNSGGIVLGATDNQVDDSSAQLTDDSNPLQLADEDIVMNLISKIDDEQHADFTNEILTYVKGRPMEDMAPYIAKQPRIVAAFIVGISMKESKFGVYAPHDANGNDCHNYWGYRGPENTTASGYSCFATPEDAVTAVGRRIARLVDQGASNPSEMVVWKCGASCSWDNPENVRSWIADVGINFYKLNNKS
ncbi:MAG TPA: hypothetical protein VMQ48_02255 [Candidatus Saccharimonadales bacterium]|nr:hypothetical protein [Candidatus Saccharimonadales bacterium]